MICCQSLAARRFLLWYILIVSLVVLPLSWDVMMGCNMILIGPVSESRPNLKGFGFFSSAVYDDDTGLFLGCVEYSKYLKGETDDIGFKLARFFGASLGASITLATFICLLVQCFNKHGKSCLWSFMKWTYVLALLCQGATFAIWSTDLCTEYEGQPAKCSLGSNGMTAVINGALLFGMVIATFYSSPPRNPVFRCWYATVDECETDDSEVDLNREIDDDEDMDLDVEEGKADIESHKSQKSQKSLKSQKSQKSRSSKRQSDEVSLFGSNRSVRTWRSNGPRLTVKELTRKLERKNIWPMNQTPRGDVHVGVKDTKIETTKSTKESFEDPRVRTYYRTQRNVFQKFDNDKGVTKPKSTATVQTAPSHSTDESTIESLTGKQQSRVVPVIACTPVVSKSNSRFGKAKGVETPLAETFLKQIRMRQGGAMRKNEESIMDKKKDTEEEAISLASGSTKSGSVKSGSIKSGSIKSGSGSAHSGSVKSGSQRSSGSKKSLKSTKSSQEIARSVNENASTATSVTDESQLLEQLRKSVVLKKGGVRIDETRIGNTLKIVDEYPAPSDGSMRNSKRKDDGTAKATGSEIVKVRTEYCPEGRKTIMEESRPDGSCLVTTLIDPFTIDDDDEMGQEIHRLDLGS